MAYTFMLPSYTGIGRTPIVGPGATPV